MAKKTAAPTPVLIPQVHGGALLSGGLQNNGGGRPPNAWKAKMEQLADRWAQAAESQKVLDDPDHPQWMNAGRFCAEQAHGKPKDQAASPKRVMRFIFVDETGQPTGAVELADGELD